MMPNDFTSDFKLEFSNQSIGNVVWNLTECVDIQVKYPDLVDLICVRIIVGILYTIVLLVGISGNLLVLYCILYMQINVGVNSALILSLALSDLLLSITSLPISGLHGLVRIWLFGWFACKTTAALHGGCGLISVFTLTAIAVDRYRLMHGCKVNGMMGEVRRNKMTQGVLVVLLWLLGFLLVLPTTLVMQLTDAAYGVCGPFCEEQWDRVLSTGHVSQIYGSVLFLAQFLMPFFVLIFCYGKLRRQVERSASRRLRYRLSIQAKISIRRRKQRTLRIVVLMCAAFAVSWLPINLLNISRDFNLVPLEYTGIAFVCSHLAAMSSVIWNPVIYCWLNSDFQNQFFSLVRCERDFSTQNLLKTNRFSASGYEYTPKPSMVSMNVQSNGRESFRGYNLDSEHMKNVDNETRYVTMAQNTGVRVEYSLPEELEMRWEEGEDAMETFL